MVLYLFLSCFLACPHKEELKGVKKVFGYLKGFPVRQIKVDHQDLKVFPMLPTPDASFKEQNLHGFKELDEQFPVPFRPLIQSSIFFDFDQAQNLKTKRTCSGIIVYVGLTPVSWSSKDKLPSRLVAMEWNLWRGRLHMRMQYL